MYDNCGEDEVRDAPGMQGAIITNTTSVKSLKYVYTHDKKKK